MRKLRRTTRAKLLKHEVGSGNLFADVGLKRSRCHGNHLSSSLWDRFAVTGGDNVRNID